MPEKIDLGEVLARNPQVDPSRLEETMETLRRLHEKGLRRKEYELASPFGGRRAAVQDNTRMEPRLGHLAKARDTD